MHSNISSATREVESQYSDGNDTSSVTTDPQVYYTADELYLTLPGTWSVEAIEARFDELWGQYSETPTIDERIAELEKVVSAIATANMNLME